MRTDHRDLMRTGDAHQRMLVSPQNAREAATMQITFRVGSTRTSRNASPRAVATYS